MMTCISGSIPTPMKSAGQIQVIFGPMFSGKTTELIRRMKRFQIANYNCLMIKYANDVRYNKDDVATHDSQRLPAISTMALMSLFKDAMRNDVIGVDEGQFFPDLVDFCEKLANNGKVVIVAGLDGTYQRKAFDVMLQLVPLAESVMKLTAVCMMCYGEASFTKRKGMETQLEVIGGADKYLAVCRRCYEMSSPAKSPRQPQVSINTESGSVGRQLFNSPAKNSAMQIS